MGEALEEGQRGENAAIAAEMDAEETTAEETAITGEMDAEETTAEETAIAAAIAQAKMEAAEEEAAITAEMEKVEREAAEEEEAIAAEVEQAEMAATEEEAAVAAEVKQAETAAAEEEEAREARKETAAAARVAMDALAKQAVKAAEAAEAARDEAATLAYKARESERATGAASGEGEDGSHRDDSQLTSGDRVTPARSPDALPQVRLSFGPDVPPPPSPEPAPRAQPPSADADADAAPTRSPARDAAPAYSSASPSAGPPGPRGESPSAEKDAERDLEPASLPEAVASLALGESEGGEAPGMTDPPVAVGAGVLVPAIAWAMDSGFLRTADPVGFSILQLVSLSAALSASLSVVAAALHVPRCIGPVAGASLIRQLRPARVISARECTRASPVCQGCQAMRAPEAWSPIRCHYISRFDSWRAVSVPGTIDQRVIETRHRRSPRAPAWYPRPADYPAPHVTHAVVSGVIPALLATSVSPKAQAAATLMGFAACSGFLEEVMLRDARTRLKLATHFVIIAGAAAGVFYAVSRMAGGVLSPPGVGIMDWVAVTGNAVDGGGIGIATGARGAALVSVVVTGLVAVLFR